MVSGFCRIDIPIVLSRLHIFNPDTDYALASPRHNYTPPARIVEYRKQYALLPSVYASAGDRILLLDRPDYPLENLRYHDICREKNLQIIKIGDLERHPERYSGLQANPWGWNHSIRLTLLNRVGEMPGMPTEAGIEKIKALSHRRLTIDMLKEMADILTPEIELPVEIFNPAEGMAAFHDNRERIFKAPWSSSGRGILLTDDLEDHHVEPWLRGIISRQKSVMMEKVYKRSIDFASEWTISEGVASFIGYSVFIASRRGKYHSNLTGSQTELKHYIKEKAKYWNDTFISVQKRAIEKLIAPHYSGPLGIDMLGTESGSVNPCVEINLRHTMGMVNLYI